MKTIYIESGKNEPGRLQAAINRLDREEGMIHLLQGKHYSYPIHLYSNTHLHLEMGAELIFSDDFSLYEPVKTRWEGTESYALQPLIFAENCQNISICGEGTICGNGQKWWNAYEELRQGFISPEVKKVQEKLLPLNEKIRGGSGGGGRETGFLRPSLIQFKKCSHVSIKDITLKDSPFWNTHILYSYDVKLQGVKFENPQEAPNTDGLDIDSSSHVLVENCHFDVGDDCLCLKSGMDADGIKVGKATSNITVKNCTMKKGHGGIVLGSETSGGINNVIVESCFMEGTDRGIRIKTRRGRGGTIDSIFLKDIVMKNVAAPIVMNMYYRCGAEKSEIPSLSSLDSPMKIDKETTPQIKNITLKNIKAHNVQSNSAFFLGLPESPIENITIENFHSTVNKVVSLTPAAMDLFHSQALSHAIAFKFLKNTSFKEVHIEGMEDLQIQELILEERQ